MKKTTRIESLEIPPRPNPNYVIDPLSVDRHFPKNQLLPDYSFEAESGLAKDFRAALDGGRKLSSSERAHLDKAVERVNQLHLSAGLFSARARVVRDLAKKTRECLEYYGPSGAEHLIGVARDQAGLEAAAAVFAEMRSSELAKLEKLQRQIIEFLA